MESQPRSGDEMSLEALIEAEYEARHRPRGGRLFTNEEPYFYSAVLAPVITRDLISIDDHTSEGITWSFDISSVDYESASLTSSSRYTLMLERYKARHEFVSEGLGIMATTDKRLREVLPPEKDEDDLLTPDFVWKDVRGVYHVVELTTTRSLSEDSLRRAFDIKVFKYKLALENRAIRGASITFTVIVVSPTSVMSSIGLNEKLITELVVRVRIGIALEDKAKSIGLSFESSEGETQLDITSGMIKGVCSDMPYVRLSRNPLILDEAYSLSIHQNPSESIIFDIFLKYYKDTVSEVEDYTTKTHDFENIINELYLRHTQGERTYKNKSPSNLPFVVVDRTISDTDIKEFYITELYDVVETRLWSIATDSYRTDRSKNIPEDVGVLLQEALETEYQNISYYEGKRKEMKSKYHRVKISQALSLSEKIQLAKQGLWAKKYHEEEWMKVRRAEQKLPFHWDTDTSDIDDFLNSREVFSMVREGISIPDESISHLLSEANGLMGNSDAGLSAMNNWKRTRLYEAMDLISDVAMELAISNKQHCVSGSGILKKLRFFNCYLLIFPTKSNEHMFYTLFFPGENVWSLAGAFRSLIRVPEGYITPLSSVKQSKLENWASMSSSLISLVSFWSWFYELEDETPATFLANSEACKMLLLSLLIRIEDKACTEEVITQSRYMYMEIFKSSILPFPPDPLKLTSKFPDRCRSRLQLWCMKQIVDQFQCMVRNKPSLILQEPANLVEGEDALPKDSWSGLLNCFTGGEVRSASKVVNLFYLGYLKNKNESPEGNTDFQLLEKTLEEEFKFDVSKPLKSKGESSLLDLPKDKQFSRKCIQHGCKLMEQRLSEIQGRDWRQEIESQVYRKLAQHSTEAIATLKASSSIDHSQAPSKANHTDPMSAMRIKVLESVVKDLELLKLNPFLALDKIVNKIETTSKGVISDLFKKQQHGGLREIYVLTLYSRIVQLFIETIARVICSHFEEETLTHPRNKLKKLDEHRRLGSRISSKRNGISVDLCSSSDKTRWNQNLVMPALAIPLLRFTPPNLHNVIMRILNMWTHKLIKIPQSVVKLLLNKTSLSSPVYAKLQNLFWDPNPNCPIFDKPLDSFVRLQTGMMQGILHYTSSLLHLTFLFSSNRICLMLLHNSFPDLKFQMTQICSSDDSASVLTIHSEMDALSPSKQTMMAVARGAVLLESLNKTCAMYCMKNSVKSVTAIPNYVEFNSEFLFNNTLAMAVIKFLSATLSLSESESFLTRFHTQYNLISDLFSSGFTAQHTHLAQLAQGNFHYKTLGSSTNALFTEWEESALRFPDPVFGFFVLDVDLMPGCMGFSFPHWLIASSTPIFQYKSRALHQHPWVVTPDGGVTQTLILKHGEVRRWKLLIDRVKGELDLEEAINKDPSILYRKPITVDELKTKLSLKATLPGVGKSMQRGNPFMQSLAMSVYAINTHAFSLTTVTQDQHGTILKSKQKVCLLGEMRRLMEREPIVQERDLMLISFPNADRYEEALSVVRSLRNSKLVGCPPFRNRKTEVMIQNRVSALPLSLYDVVTHLWFGQPIRASQKVFQRCLSSYKLMMTWIRPTVEDSLQDSPFMTHQELYNFVSVDGLKPRLFKRNGPAIHSKRLKGQLFNLIRKSQRPCKFLREGSGVPLRNQNDLITTLNLTLNIPEDQVRNTRVRNCLLNRDKIYDDLASISNMTRRDATLAYIQGICREDFTLEEASIHMRQMRLGAHVSYIKEQDFDIIEGVKIWKGRGAALVMVESCNLMVEFNDSDVVSIRCDDWKNLKSNVAAWNHLARDLRVRSIPSSTRLPGVVARWNGQHIVRSTDIGTPIFQLRETQRMHFDISRLKIRIMHNELSIIQQVGPLNHPTEVVVLKYRQSGGDVISSIAGAKSESVWEGWTTRSVVEPESLSSFMIQTERIATSRPHIKSWLKETLSSRLNFLGLMTTRLTSQIPEDPDQEEEATETLTDREIKEIMDQFNADLLSNRARMLEAPVQGEDTDEVDIAEQMTLLNLGVITELPLWLPIVRNWEEVESPLLASVMPVRGISFMSLHPMWNEVIDMFSKHRGFWVAVSEGKVYPGLESASRRFMKLLDIVERRKLKPGALERFMQAADLKHDYLPEPNEDDDDKDSQSSGQHDTLSNLDPEDDSSGDSDEERAFILANF